MKDLRVLGVVTTFEAADELFARLLLSLVIEEDRRPRRSGRGIKQHCVGRRVAYVPAPQLDVPHTPILATEVAGEGLEFKGLPGRFLRRQFAQQRSRGIDSVRSTLKDAHDDGDMAVERAGGDEVLHIVGNRLMQHDIGSQQFVAAHCLGVPHV